MFGFLRAGGFAAATIALTLSGIGHTQVLPSATPTIAAPATPDFAPIFDVSPQLALPVQSAPATSPIQLTPLIQPASPVQPIAVITPEPAPFAAPPASEERLTLAQLVSEHRASETATRELECLAGAIYFEAKGEPLTGQVAVGQVVANRAKSGRFPGSYCGVVFQRSQFSFVHGRALPPIPRASANWRTAVAIAHIVANDLTQAVAPKSLFFHARYVSPGWKNMSRVATVGNHIFYR